MMGDILNMARGSEISVELYAPLIERRWRWTKRIEKKNRKDIGGGGGGGREWEGVKRVEEKKRKKEEREKWKK